MADTGQAERSTGMAKKAKRDGKARREARRAERLHDRLAAAERRVAKRLDQLGEAVARRDLLAARLAAPVTAPTAEDAGPAETAMRGGASSATEAASASPVQAFCLRERRRVDILDPEQIVLSNGRAAIAGTCPSCGVRVVRTGGRPG